MLGSGLRDHARGYHIYKEIWEASTKEQLLYQRESGDPIAVEVTLGSSTLNERYWACFLLVVLPPSTLFCSLPQPSHTGQLEIGDSVDQGHCK